MSSQRQPDSPVPKLIVPDVGGPVNQAWTSYPRGPRSPIHPILSVSGCRSSEPIFLVPSTPIDGLIDKPEAETAGAAWVSIPSLRFIPSATAALKG